MDWKQELERLGAIWKHDGNTERPYALLTSGRISGHFADALIINPGVRSFGANTHDQQRVDTPGNAIRNGADLIVVGRQILGIETMQGRINEAKAINEEVNAALKAA